MLAFMVENCKNIVIKIEDKVITGMVDIWKSENISLDVRLGKIPLFSLQFVRN